VITVCSHYRDAEQLHTHSHIDRRMLTTTQGQRERKYRRTNVCI